MLIPTKQWIKENPENIKVIKKLEYADDESWIVLRLNTDHPYPAVFGLICEYPLVYMEFHHDEYRKGLEFNGLTLSTSFLMMWKSDKGLMI